ncbi:hypothetical protein [Aquipuribacter nitratireducens]|uniref:Uncharacterized protein n=1 Tax=Aquipuribacter nitratireducens TaxID=650104 RepID=A0ABW0GNA9_9MICO
MSGSPRPVRAVVLLAALSLVLLPGCVSDRLPDEGPQGAVTAGPPPEDTSAGETAEPIDPTGAPETTDATGAGEATGAAGDALAPCEAALAEGGDRISDAFDACETYEEFRDAAASYPDALDGNQPDIFVFDRCESLPAVQGSALCEDIEQEGG